MALMNKLALIGSLILLSFGTALAAGPTANLSWVAPTEYTDNTPLPASDIAFYTIQWDTKTLQVNAPATSSPVNVLCGSTTFTVTVTTKSTAKYPNSVSSPSGSVPYATGVTCSPKPVTGVTVS